MKNTNKKLDLDKLEEKLDEQLELETEESLTDCRRWFQTFLKYK